MWSFKTGLFLLAVTAIGFASCQKKDTTPADPQSVTFTVAMPFDGQTFHNGDTVHINGTVNYPAELHGYEVKITDTTTGFIVYDDAEHLHDDHFDIADTWVNTTSATQSKSLQLDIIAVIDHDGTVATKTIFINSQP